jgi:hypothetical protein
MIDKRKRETILKTRLGRPVHPQPDGKEWLNPTPLGSTGGRRGRPWPVRLSRATISHPQRAASGYERALRNLGRAS